DAQLALVIGHELAHANLGHLEKQRANKILGWAGGAAIDAGMLLAGIPTGGAFVRELGRAGERAFSVGFEREADYVGAYYAARAASISQARKSSGAHSPWKIPTAFVLL
ncbi:MAG: M48 family metalloprotease, partial [Pseudolabrys sp.]